MDHYDPNQSPQQQQQQGQGFSNPETPGYVGFANLPNQVHRKSVKKGFEFTLMVVGESGLGKSTLVNSLFLTDLYPDRVIPDAVDKVTQTVKLEESSVSSQARAQAHATTRLHTHALTHTHAHTHIRTRSNPHINTYKHPHTYTYTYTHTHTHARLNTSSIFSSSLPIPSGGDRRTWRSSSTNRGGHAWLRRCHR